MHLPRFSLAVLLFAALALPAFAETPPHRDRLELLEHQGLGPEIASLEPVSAAAPRAILAQTAPPANPSAPAPDVGAMVTALLTAAQHGQWGIVVSTGLMLLILVFRLLLAKLPASAFTEFMKRPWVGWVMNFVGALAGGIVTALATGQPVTVLLVITCLTNALAASGTWELLKDMFGKPQVLEAKAAGAAAVVAAGTDTKAGAVAALKAP